MSDQPRYNEPADDRTLPRYEERTAYEQPSWAPQRTSDAAQKVRLDRPFYTGMVFGFGLMVATLVASIIFAIIFGVIGTMLGGLLVGV